MKAFFANMNLARAIILLSLIGSAVLAWRGWQLEAEAETLEGALAIEVPKAVQEIQKDAALHTKLTRDKEGDQFLRQDNAEVYIRKVATRKDTEMGEVDLNPGEGNNIKGIIDYTHQIVPHERTRAYTRARIGNFLYYLEDQSRRIKVTDIKLSLIDSRAKPEDVPNDEWTFEAEITSRQKLETGS